MEEIPDEAAEAGDEEPEVASLLERVQETRQIIGFPEMEVTEEDATSINLALER